MKNEYNAEIIAVGTELLLGQIANTNAQWISQQLALSGVNTFYHSVVGDNIKRVESIFKKAHERSNIIIVSGGLGPTSDDLTREAFQVIYDDKIISHEPSLIKIKAHYKKRGLIMTPNNERQARVFENTEKIIMNKYGMAPGMIIEYQGRIWIFLPGVPKEMKQMTKDTVLPYLEKRNGKTVIQSRVLRFFGVGESRVEHDLQDLIKSQENPTIAPLAEKNGVTIRLTAKADSVNKAQNLLEETKSKVLEKVGEYYYGEDTDTLQEKVKYELEKAGLWLASAESLTGGKFIENLISVSGASKVCRGGVVCYDSSVKINLLNVPAQLIKSEGTISDACARTLARNVAHKLDANIGISFTGIAGPEPVENKPVGTVFIGIYINGLEEVHEFKFLGEREDIRHLTMMKGFELIYNLLTKKLV
ncbi:MAG TPA: competence/damage-inducible protein A [Pseudogracilibacillus sp.]|nr:competence/damage-inducible protein A [Pseudogracilibacillus sp.]